MSELAFLGSVAALYFVLAASPGPNFVIITQAAASRSRSYAIALGAGVSTASVIWAGLAAAGLGVVIARYGELYRWIQLAGGAYLLHLGLKMLRGGGRTAVAAPGADLPGGWSEGWRLGLWTNMTNPKSLAFFSSAFAALFSPGLPSWVQAAAVAVVGVISFSWNLVVVCVFSRQRVRRAYQGTKRWIDAGSGCLLAFFGFRLMSGALEDVWRARRG